MSKPIVAVVGRPNVGKSTLFNKLCGQRLAIVEDTPGITRDRIFANCEWSGHEFLLVDTGGIEPKATEGILATCASRPDRHRHRRLHHHGGGRAQRPDRRRRGRGPYAAPQPQAHHPRRQQMRQRGRDPHGALRVL